MGQLGCPPAVWFVASCPWTVWLSARITPSPSRHISCTCAIVCSRIHRPRSVSDCLTGSSSACVCFKCISSGWTNNNDAGSTSSLQACMHGTCTLASNRRIAFLLPVSGRNPPIPTHRSVVQAKCKRSHCANVRIALPFNIQGKPFRRCSLLGRMSCILVGSFGLLPPQHGWSHLLFCWRLDSLVPCSIDLQPATWGE